MKTLKQHIAEAADRADNPVVGDNFAIEILDECLIESYVVGTTEDGIVIEGDERLLALLEEYGFQLETIRRYGAVGSSPGMGYTVGEDELAEGMVGNLFRKVGSIAKKAVAKEPTTKKYQPARDSKNPNPSDVDVQTAIDQVSFPSHPATARKKSQMSVSEDELGRILKLAEVAPQQPETDSNRNDPLAAKAADDAAVGPLEEDGVDPVNAQGQDAEDLQGQATSSVTGAIDEAEYQGRTVKLGKPFLTPDGPKKRSVYVRNPKGNIVKVNFGDPNMRIKKSSPKNRKSFRARHNCDNPGPRTSARYWSCRLW